MSLSVNIAQDWGRMCHWVLILHRIGGGCVTGCYYCTGLGEDVSLGVNIAQDWGRMCHWLLLLHRIGGGCVTGC